MTILKLKPSQNVIWLILGLCLVIPLISQGSLVNDLDHQIQEQESKRLELEKKAKEYQAIIDKKDEQFGLESEKSKSLEKELKRQKRNTFLWKLGTIAGGVLALFFAAGG